MTEILTQAEIDQLLTAIGAGDSASAFKDNKDFENYLTGRTYAPEKSCGS